MPAPIVYAVVTLASLAVKLSKTGKSSPRKGKESQEKAEDACDRSSVKPCPRDSGIIGGKDIGILRDSSRGKGNFGLGTATRAEADKLGKAWVGDGYKVASDGKTLVSKDGLKQYRPPSYKPRLDKVQANFEQRFSDQKSKKWQSNGHLDITE